ncbi:MAG: D-2-hydroxyacid dehydrogenase [Sediminibacterium magnilacihabitans]|jgi:glycerate dehydrogenase|nr:D-2-hydroxyacid dehydrogenase [Sediminibacterium magnilacihabitans]PQV60077.1 glycerate dehydrogenase [Sediminibacterium magnilacihabitans]
MKIIVLDGYALNPGDLSWEALQQSGELTVYDRTPADQIVKRCEGAEIVFTNKTPLTAETLKQLNKLQYIGVLATGYNVVNTAAAKTQGIIVCNAPDYSTASVVQTVFALLLELTNHVQRHSDAVASGKWSQSKDWCFWDYPLSELSGKTIGIIGFGNIGQKVAAVGAAFGMHILCTSRTRRTHAGVQDFRWVDTPELLSNADVISLHCPLVPETKGLINKTTLSQMKRTAFLINTSRGPVVEDDDLAHALNNDVIAGAGLDVLTTEPPPPDNPLLKAKNCIITPHIGWASKEARLRLMQITVDNLNAFMQGKPVNVVN